MTLLNNIGLDSQTRLARQLVAYQEKFQGWWRERGPVEFLDRPMRLRTPTGAVHGSDWAEYVMLRPDQYRWGIFMAPTHQDEIAFGDHRGKKVWDEVPGEYRTMLMRHISVQGDAENASIEQSRTLTQTAPSGPDLENLFQFFLEEGRHSWAMVHLLLAHFGEDGVVEAETLLDRMSGDSQHPRVLEAFNYSNEDWLSYFIWCFLADRVGKYQIQAVTQSAFAPLAKTARFMMFEEPLHIAFGAVGLERVLCGTVAAMLREGTADGFQAGVIPLAVIQKYLNYWAPKVYDLFGSDDSDRAYELFRAGIRSPRGSIDGARIRIDVRTAGDLVSAEVAAERAINAVMRRRFIAEVQMVIERWNASLRALGIDVRLYLPHERFRRAHGPCSGLAFSVTGEPLVRDAQAKLAEYLPTAGELANVRALMERELTPGRVAPWIAAPEMRLSRLVRNFSVDQHG